MWVLVSFKCFKRVNTAVTIMSSAAYFFFNHSDTKDIL